MIGPGALARLRSWTRSGFYLGLNNVITPLFGLASSIVLTRLLAVNEYGHYALFLSAILFLDFTSLTGIGTAIIHAAARGLEGTLRPATRARILGSLLGTAVLVAIGGYRTASGDTGAALLWLACGAAFPFYFPYTNALYHLIGVREFPRLVRVQALQLTLSYVPMLVVALATRNYGAVLLAHLLATPLSRYVLYRTIVARIPRETPTDPAFLGYGLNLTLMGMFGSLEMHLDRIFLGTYFSPATLATFHVGKNIGFQGRYVWNVAYQYVFSSLARRSETDRSFPRELFLVLAIYLLALGGMYALAPWVIGIAYPSEYLESTVTAQWFILASALGGPASVFDTYFLASGRMRASWTGRLGRTLSYLASLYFLVGRFGVEGFYYAAVGSNALHSFLGAVLVFAAVQEEAPGSA